MSETLIALSQRKLTQNISEFARYLLPEIDWEQRMTLLLGHRGSGKTTLLLQALKGNPENSIYLTLDHLYFEDNRLITIIEELHAVGYRNFYLDEVHRYAHWSADLKSAYDAFPDIFIVATGSSILEIAKGKADLSRRALAYHLYGLSFREYLNLKHGHHFEVLTLDEILSNHADIATAIADKIAVQTLFNAYTKSGYYPFFMEGERSYLSKLMEVTNLIIEVDIVSYEDINYSTVRNLKRLLYLISQSVPYKPNVSKLAEVLGVARNTVLKMLDLLHRAQVLNLLKTDGHGNNILQKPDKVYLHNTNLCYLLGGVEPNPGNLRETFFMNQVSVKHDVQTSRFADFLVDGRYTFEVGGPGKNEHQIRGVGEAYLAIDGIKSSQGNRIPLWLFGFLY